MKFIKKAMFLSLCLFPSILAAMDQPEFSISGKDILFRSQGFKIEIQFDPLAQDFERVSLHLMTDPETKPREIFSLDFTTNNLEISLAKNMDQCGTAGIDREFRSNTVVLGKNFHCFGVGCILTVMCRGDYELWHPTVRYLRNKSDTYFNPARSFFALMNETTGRRDCSEFLARRYELGIERWDGGPEVRDLIGLANRILELGSDLAFRLDDSEKPDDEILGYFKGCPELRDLLFQLAKRTGEVEDRLKEKLPLFKPLIQ